MRELKPVTLTCPFCQRPHIFRIVDYTSEWGHMLEQVTFTFISEGETCGKGIDGKHMELRMNGYIDVSEYDSSIGKRLTETNK
jgi:hypothetical protein